jgi:hypothetical protein
MALHLMPMTPNREGPRPQMPKPAFKRSRSLNPDFSKKVIFPNDPNQLLKTKDRKSCSRNYTVFSALNAQPHPRVKEL